jgi:hypothetical protein
MVRFFNFSDAVLHVLNRVKTTSYGPYVYAVTPSDKWGIDVMHISDGMAFDFGYIVSDTSNNEYIAVYYEYTADKHGWYAVSQTDVDTALAS